MKWTETTTTSTGDVDGLDFGDADLLRCNNASLMTIRGLKAGVQGQRLAIVSVGAGQVDLSHQDTGEATAANRLICFATSAKTSLAAGVGAAILEYDATTARWRLIAREQGAWITPTFSAGDYSGSGSMTWTVDSGDVMDCSYFLVGRVLNLGITIVTSTVGGTLDLSLQRVIPGGFTVLGNMCEVIRVLNNGTEAIGYATAQDGQTVLKFQRSIPPTNWSASTNNTYVLYTGAIPVA